MSPPIEVPTQSTCRLAGLAAAQHPAQARGLRGRGHAGEQRRGVGEIKPEGIIALMRQPFALAAARHVHAHDMAATGEAFGQRVEIAGVAREAMDAEHEPGGVRIAPFGIGDVVKSVGA